MQYVTYRRVSTREQGKSGLGLDAQTRDIGIFLNTYSPEPWEVIGEYVEVSSGANDERSELQKAIAEARRTGATLLVAKLDRLSRRVSFIASLMDDKRLSLKVATMPHAEKFQLHIYAALAEQERDFISQRTKDALAQAKAKGVKLGGPKRQVALKMGWKTNKADAVKHAENLAPIINAIQATGVKTLQGLSDALNIRGVRTRRGGTWHPTTVKNILDRTIGN